MNMTKSEVNEALYNGKKVALPEWTGYWFMEDSEIKVYTKEGEVLDCPYLDLLDARSDWEIVTGERDFSGILYAIKAGKRVSRIGWNGKDQWLIKIEQSIFDSDSIWIGIKTTNDQFFPWTPSQGDLFAEDWIILD
jgi:hypothetical protein